MSIEALTWAFEQEVSPASRKFVLVALANYASETGLCYPSTETICRLTALDRKTVIQCLDDLEKQGQISDTGNRTGATKQIKVFKIKASQKRKGSENGTVPVLDGKAPNFSVKGSRFFPEGSQKRDTDTSLTVREPKVNPNTRASANGRKPSSVDEVLTKGQFIGLSEQDCRDWFRDCEACNWCRGDGTPFDNWSRQLVIHRDKLAERRSKGTVNGNSRPTSIQDIRTVIQFKEEKARAIKERYSVEGPTSTDWNDANKRTEYFALRKEIKELKAKAERMVMP